MSRRGHFTKDTPTATQQYRMLIDLEQPVGIPDLTMQAEFTTGLTQSVVDVAASQLLLL